MALQFCSRRLGASLTRSATSYRVVTSRTVSSATAASNLPQEERNAIEKEAALKTPDPPSDSQTSRIVNDHLGYMVPTYVRPPPMFAKGEGCYLWDVENRQYLDFTAGIAVNSLGHCDPEMATILFQQGSTLIHTSNLYHNPWTGALSKLLVESTQTAGGMHNAARAFICNSGSEANESALKFARKYGRIVDESGNKSHLVSFHNSFHGRTMGALSATPNPKYQKPFSPMIPNFSYGNFNDIEAIPELITENTCGVIVEPIQGEGGVNVATPEFLAALRQRCTEVKALLIFDEIQCGMGRTGMLWAHGALPKESHPDIITTAKALGNGFPIGATIVNEDVSSAIVTGDHGTTFGGNPLGSRVAHYVVNRLMKQELMQSVVAKEALLRSHFQRLQQRFPNEIKEVRGRGLILGLQLAGEVTQIITAARERGLLIISCGVNTLRFVPPLTIEEWQIDEGMRILEDAMSSVWNVGEDPKGTPGQQEMQNR